MLWNTLTRNTSRGRLTASGYPASRPACGAAVQAVAPIGQATMAYGYGLSMTPLQLAQAYGVLAGDGLSRPISLVRVDKPPIARRVVSPETARNVVAMLEQVVTAEGTGIKASVAGYRVAGKTGTARKVAAGGYAQDRHTAAFSGMVPVTAPRLVIVVVVDEPQGAYRLRLQRPFSRGARAPCGSLQFLQTTRDAGDRAAAKLAPGADPCWRNRHESATCSVPRRRGAVQDIVDSLWTAGPGTLRLFLAARSTAPGRLVPTPCARRGRWRGNRPKRCAHRRCPRGSPVSRCRA